jgi:hypothetical protein
MSNFIWGKIKKSEIMKFEEIVIVRVTTAYTYCTITTVLYSGINT